MSSWLIMGGGRRVTRLLIQVNAKHVALRHLPRMATHNARALNVHLRPHDKYLRLIDAAQKLPPVTTAVVHPCDEASLGGAVEARKLRLIEPILVGPPGR